MAALNLRWRSGGAVACGLVALLTVGHGGALHAQSTAFTIDNMPNIAAIGIGVAPDYVGSADYMVAGAPSGRLTFANNRYVKLVGPRVTSNLINHETFRLGPALNYRFGRSDVEDPVVDRMQDIEGTVELGLATGLQFINGVNPRYQFNINLDVLFDVGGEHDDIVSNFSVGYWRPLAKAFSLGLVGATQFGGADFTDRYFGVSAQDSARSGLPRYSADGGLKDFSFSAIGVLHLGPTWHVGAGVRYQYLLDEVADSPVVATRGDRDQVIAGIGVAYAW